jgi:SAM-dependent methyltransferase
VSPLRRALARSRRVHPALEALSAEDRRYLSTAFDDSTPLPKGAERELREDNPRLRALRETYARLGGEVASAASRWNRESIGAFLDLRYFRGDTLITWHYRESRRVTELKYFLLWRDVRERDHLGLLDTLAEDGAFGCWTFRFPSSDPISRDLLDSVRELAFLDRELAITTWDGLRILDVGAGYGRLAHRAAQALPALGDYCCVDAIPESTFLCEYYLRHREVSPPARVVPLDGVRTELKPGSFDLAINVHSFSECPFDAIRWWLNELARLEVPRLMLVPNDGTALLSLEADGSRRDFSGLLRAAGYRLAARDPAVADAEVRELLELHDHLHLFVRD